MSTTTPEPESLLCHRDFVRGLARGLLHGASDADDVVQDTWVAAAQQPRPPEWPLAAWLGGIARNMARHARREQQRRRRREHLAARPEPVRSTADLVAGEEARQLLVAAVLRLAEPMRTAVLLRYYDGLSPRAIAHRLGLPGATVRSHLHRGLVQLRQRLDAGPGGRSAWTAALSPLARTSATAWQGVALMSMGKKMIAAALLLLAAVGGVWWSQTGASASPPAAPATGDPAPVAATEELPVRTAAPVAASVAGPAILVVAAEDRAPLAAVSIDLAAADGRSAHGVTDAAGRFAPPWSGEAALWAGCRGRALRWLPAVTLAQSPVVVELEPAAAPQVRFVDERGTGISGTAARRRYAEAGIDLRVELVADAALTSGDVPGMLRTLVGPARLWRQTVALQWSDAGAEFATGLAEGSWRLFASRPDAPPFLGDPVAVSAASAPEFVIRLRTRASGRRVRLLDAEDGTPLSGASLTPFVELGDDAAFFAGAARPVDAYGEVELPLPAREPRRRAATWWATTSTHAAMLVIAPGDGVMQVRVPRRGDVVGHAFARSGAAAAGCAVVAAVKGMVMRTTVAADGTFALRGVPAGRKPLFLLDATATQLMFVDKYADVPAGGVLEVDLGKPRDGGARVAGRVTAAGQGVPAFVGFRSANAADSGGIMAGGDGRFELRAVATGGLHLDLLVGDTTVCDDFGLHSRAPLVLQPGEVRTLDFDLPAGVMRVRVVDAATGAAVAGAAVVARPVGDGVQQDRFPGFRYTPGFAARTDARGEALLRALAEGELHVVEARVDGSEPAGQQAMPGTGEPPTLELRLPRRQ